MQQSNEPRDGRFETFVARYRRVSELVTRGVHGLAMVLSGVLVTVVVARVALRSLLDVSLVWVPELSSFLAIWISLLLAGVLIKEERHMNVKLLFDRFSPTVKRRLRLAQLCAIVVLNALVLYYGTIYALGSRTQVSSAMRIDLSVVYAIFPIASGLMLFFAVERILLLYSDSTTLDGRPSATEYDADRASEYGTDSSSAHETDRPGK